jgi:symplekin
MSSCAPPRFVLTTDVRVRAAPTDAATRNPAIAAVRLWVPDTAPMAESIRSFALSLLRRLQKAATTPSPIKSEAKAEDIATDGRAADGLTAESSAPAAVSAPAPVDGGGGDVVMNAAEESEEVEHEVESRYLPPTIDLAHVETEVVRQHVELLFALTKKVPELLDSCVPSFAVELRSRHRG